MGIRRHVAEDPALGGALKRGQLLLLAACDSSYVPPASALARSLDVFSPGHTLLVHVVNPSDEAIDSLHHLSTQLHHTRLLISSESTDLAGLSPVQQRTYYACARFFRLCDLLPSSECDFLVLDADSLVVSQIDRDFSDKPEAEICLRRRDLTEPQPEHLAVAAGSIWLRSTEGTRQFFSAVGADILSAFESGNAGWYLDQIALKRRIDDPAIKVAVRNIKSKYADWEFRDSSVIWQGKGNRKYLDVRFLLLEAGLSANRQSARRATALYSEFGRLSDPGTHEPLDQRLEAVLSARPRRVVFLLPRLDLPWKLAGMRKGIPPVIDPDILDLRLYWVRFLSSLANECERAGLDVEILQLPAWEINREFVESLAASVVLVPHRCRHDFEAGQTPVLFYMQEYFRWLFVVDSEGWSAASSIYPVSPAQFPVESTGAFDEYRRRLSAGGLDSKFKQPPRRGATPLAQPLASTGASASFSERWRAALRRWIEPNAQASTKPQVPASAQGVPSIFFPMQIPHDQSIRYFSDYPFDAVLGAVAAWAESKGVVLNIKPHPANLALTAGYRERFPESTWIRWRDESIHDLIDETQAVFTVNSGVGFEALLHGKPVVTFGRAEYDCVTVRAVPNAVDAAWKACCASTRAEREARYRAFFDWFVDDYAVDLSRPKAASVCLARIAAKVAVIAKGVPEEASLEVRQ